MLPIRNKASFYDAYLRVITFIQRLRGIKHPSRPVILWFRRFSPILFTSQNPKDIKSTLKAAVIGRMFLPSPHPNIHQYTALITEIHEDPAPDVADVITRAAKIHYGVSHIQDNDVATLENSIARYVKKTRSDRSLSVRFWQRKT